MAINPAPVAYPVLRMLPMPPARPVREATGEERRNGLRGCVICRRDIVGCRPVHDCAIGPGEGKPARDAWRLVGQRDNWICRLCGSPVDPARSRSHPLGPSLDHRIPRCQGGSHAMDNLQITHSVCNWVRDTTPLDDFHIAQVQSRIAYVIQKYEAGAAIPALSPVKDLSPASRRPSRSTLRRRSRRARAAAAAVANAA